MLQYRGVTPLFVYSGSDIDELNRRQWLDISRFGKPLTFGTPNILGFRKKAYEIYAVTQLYGEAIPRLYNGKLPEGWVFSDLCNRDYVNNFGNPDKGDQYYTYGYRFHEAFQAERMRDELAKSIETGVQSNRIVGVIWDKWEDLEQEAPPCWNWCQLRKMEDNLVSLRTLFRSHCFVNGDWANYCGLTRLFIDEVIEPAGGEMSELINVSTSAQIGSGDVDTVFGRIGNWFGFDKLFGYKSNVGD